MLRCYRSAVGMGGGGSEGALPTISWLLTSALVGSASYADPPQSLVGLQFAPGSRQGSLFINGSYRFSRCPQGFTKLLVSISPPASADMSHASIHRWHLPCSDIHQPGSPHSRPQSPVLLHARVCHKPPAVDSGPISGDAPSGGLIDTATRGMFCPFPSLNNDNCTCSRQLLSLTQVSAHCFRQVMRLLASCSALVPFCIFRLSFVDSPERSLQHGGRSPFKADPLDVPR